MCIRDRNKSKVEYRVPEVKYVGHLITNNGIKVDPEKVRAIRSVTVETDHKPLVAIYNKPLYCATLRLQRMLMRLQRYDLKLVYVPGKEMHWKRHQRFSLMMR